MDYGVSLLMTSHFLFSNIFTILFYMYESNVDSQPIIDILVEILGDYKLHNELKGQLTFNCPVCSYEIKGLNDLDNKYNLEVNYNYHVYKCWVCAETHETHGSIYKLIKKYGKSNHIKKYDLYKPDEFKKTDSIYIPKVRLPKEYVEFSKVSNGIKLLPQYKQAYNYLKKRNITDDIIEKFKIGFCRSGQYENRIIIPSYDSELEINYFIGRSFLSNTKLKYLNPTAEKEKIIFNEYLIDWNKPIYLVEGVFDSIFLDNAIPMLGKYISDNLFQKLYQNGGKITIVLDPDAVEDARKLYHKLNCGKLMGKVSIVELQGNQDIADLRGDLSNYETKKLD